MASLDVVILRIKIERAYIVHNLEIGLVIQLSRCSHDIWWKVRNGARAAHGGCSVAKYHFLYETIRPIGNGPCKAYGKIFIVDCVPGINNGLTRNLINDKNMSLDEII